MSLIKTAWKWFKFPFVFLWSLARENPIIACLILAFLMITVPTYLVLQVVNDNREQTDKIERQTQQIAALTKHNERAINKINREKIERREGQDNINSYVCRTNDDQDILLAGLVTVAVEILATSEIPQERDVDNRTVFESALIKLKKRPNCARIVERLKTDPNVGSDKKVKP